MAHRSPTPSSAAPSNWLIPAKQIWKLYVALLGFTLTFLCFGVGGFRFMTEGALSGTVVGSGTILGVGTFLWLLKGIRCPSCQGFLAWTMIRKQSHMSWLVDLVNLTECPLCHVDLLKATSKKQRSVKSST